MPNPVGVLQIGHLASHSDRVLGGERRDVPDDLSTADGIVGIHHVDQGRVSQDPALVQAPQEQKGQHGGEGQYGGVDETYTSMQHGIPRLRALARERASGNSESERKAVEASEARLHSRKAHPASPAEQSGAAPLSAAS